jgi:hypothetical protein
MKRFLFVASLLLVFALPTFAQTVDATLKWDPASAGDTRTSIRAYERINGAWVRIGEVICPACAELTLTNIGVGAHVYMVRAFNGQVESGNSNEVTYTVLVFPVTPANLTVIVVIKGP